MARLEINGIDVEVPEGATLLEAAQQAGVDIPTLCYTKKTGVLTSCMICVVKEFNSGRMLPACSAQALDGMKIETDGEEVRTARREILRLLLSEHVGDCEAPCSRICPASLDIPRMLRYVASGDLDAAARLAKRDLIFPATLGYVCAAPCEKGCRRALYDTPISIRATHQKIAGKSANDNKEATATGKNIAIIGAGLAGVSAAWACRQHGHDCRVYEKCETACASLRTQFSERLPQEILDAEIESVRDFGAAFEFGCEVGGAVSPEALVEKFDAVIVACALPVPPEDSTPNRIFVAHEDLMPVRSVAHGKAAARRVDAFLRGLPDDVATRPFNAQIGKLRPEEMGAYAVERLKQGVETPCLSKERGGVGSEAARCLECDCRKPVSCKLRQYAHEYGLGPHVRRDMERRPVEPIQRFDGVLFEPGKCIKCGICVEITRSVNEQAIGMTFVGRGLDARVRVSFGEDLAQGLGDAARECVRACPTGALAFRNGEETG